MEAMKGLALDHWYKVLIWIGVALSGLALTVKLQVPNVGVLCVGVGLVVFGLGQWVNHPVQVRLAGNFKITSKNRRANPAAVLAEVVGACIAAFGIYVIVANTPL